MTTGFTGADAATGPTAGHDPVMKFRKKLKKSKEDKKLVMPGNKLGESRENPSMPSRLFQYKVNIPEVGETIVYASSPAELTQNFVFLSIPDTEVTLVSKELCLVKQVSSSWIKRMKHLRNRK